MNKIWKKYQNPTWWQKWQLESIHIRQTRLQVCRSTAVFQLWKKRMRFEIKKKWLCYDWLLIFVSSQILAKASFPVVSSLHFAVAWKLNNGRTAQRKPRWIWTFSLKIGRIWTFSFKNWSDIWSQHLLSHCWRTQSRARAGIISHNIFTIDYLTEEWKHWFWIGVQ